MQDKAKKTKKKRALIYKPYKRGPIFPPVAARKGLKILLYYFLFVFLYLMLGASLQFDSLPLRIVANGALVLACGMLMYMDGAKAGEEEAALGEISLAREQSGKVVSADDAARCYHPLRGWCVFLVGIAALLAITVPYAILTQKQVYTLQTLPSWVDGFKGQSQIGQPLNYYAQDMTLSVLDVVRILVRLLIFPFANIASSDNADAMLLVERLSPLLVVLPALGYPLGYLTGPKARAMVHGDIKTSNKRRQRKERKAIKERRERAAKKNEII